MSAGYHMEDEVHQRAYDSTLMRRLLAYLRPYRWWLALALVLLLIASLVSSVSPLLVMYGVDNFLANADRTALQDQIDEAQTPDPSLTDRLSEMVQNDLRLLFLLVLLLGAFIIVEAAFRYGQLLIVAFVGQQTMYEMRMGLFAHMQTLSLRFLDRNPVGRLMSRVTNDIEKIQQTVVSGGVQVASDFITIFVVLGIMLWVNWRLTLVAIVPVPFIFITSFIFRKYARNSFLQIRKKIAAVNANMQESISGMRIVQIFGREKSNFEKFSGLNADHRNEWLRQVRYFAIYFPTVEFFSSISTSLVIFYCSWHFLTLGGYETGNASVGTIFAFISLSEKLFGPIRALADRYNMLLEAMASSERVFELLDTSCDVDDKTDSVLCERLEGAVTFENVFFRYDGGDNDLSTPGDAPQDHSSGEGTDWILKNINLEIAPGERLAIVGHTGAGKSTIINLVSRFYDVQQGRILVDGIDVRDYQQRSLRRRIGVVLQDVFLFSGSVADNIRLGDTSITDEKIRAAAAYVNAAPFIERLNGGYDHKVGERGCNLSTGQRQLVAFARALAHEPDVLVLDEATSSIDTETEMLIQDAINRLLDGDGRRRTCIVIAHRLSTIQHADRIVVLHHGEVHEVGTHQELLSKGGLYRTLYELQYKDQLVAE